MEILFTIVVTMAVCKALSYLVRHKPTQYRDDTKHWSRLREWDQARVKQAERRKQFIYLSHN
jgi:hypothetical protein